MASEPALGPMCKNCGTKAPKATSKFCTKCGNKLEPITQAILQRARCVACQKELEPGEAFCDDCGANQNVEKGTSAKVPEGNIAGSCPQETGEQHNDEVDNK